MNHTRRIACLALLVLATTSVGLPQYYPRMGKATPGGVGDEPLATFKGAVQDLDKKVLRIKSEDANTLQFVCDRKTHYFDGDKQIKITEVKPGDHVAVETKRFRNGELEAINVRLEHVKTQNAETPKNP